jgi:aerobic carbon-monoxide dehydrogenase medium subunit
VKDIIFDFEYLTPKTIEEALELISRYDEGECKVIAGGQSLLILMKHKLLMPKYLIDIKGLSKLDYIKLDDKQGLRIGALTTHRSVEISPVVQKGFSVLAEMEQNVSSVETRNWGTLAGNVCHGDPGGDPTPVLIALNAKIKLKSLSGERIVNADNFGLDYYETERHHDELLTEIEVPKLAPKTGVKFTKFSQITGDLANASAAVSITIDKKDICEDVRIALGSVAVAPMRAQKAEKILKGKKITDELLAEAGKIASEECSPISDAEISEEYKRELVKVLVRRVGKEAWERARKA